MAQVDLLGVHEVALVQQAWSSAAAQGEARTLDHLRAASPGPTGAWGRWRAQEPVEEEQAPQLAARGEHGVRGGLQRTVRVQQPRPHARSRMRVHEGKQCFQRVGLHGRVRVEQNHVLPRGLGQPLVVRAREATFSAFSISRTAKVLPHHGRAAVGRRVVDDDDFH